MDAGGAGRVSYLVQDNDLVASLLPLAEWK